MLRPPARLSPVPLASPDEVWMLAFGSNMASQTLTSRRGVVPRRSLPAVALGSALSFGMLGLPYAEPAFAVLRRQALGRADGAPRAWWPVLEAEMRRRGGPAQAAARAAAATAPRPTPPPAAHGVLHLISRDDWRRVLASEGVRGASGYEAGEELGGDEGDDEDEEEEAGGGRAGRGYRIARVSCRAYDPCARVDPPAFSRSDEAADDPDNLLSHLPLVEAVTLGSATSARSRHGARRRALPSRRYLSLLRSGAREHGLSPRYRAWLDALACYDPTPASAGPGLLMVGAAAAAAGPAAAAAAALGALGGGRGVGRKGRAPSSLAEALSSYANLAQQAAWQAHDLFGGDGGGAIGLSAAAADEEEEEGEGEEERRRQRRDDSGGGGGAR